MLNISRTSKIHLASKHVDFRKGIDTLAALCRNNLSMDPLTGDVFLFYNRQGNSLKILMHDGQGFCLLIKRLSRGKFQWIKKEKIPINICHKILHVLFNNGSPNSVKFSKDWI